MIERRRLIGNSLSIIITRLTQSITAFVLIASIARILGAYHLGQYTLGFSYYFLFMTLTSQGFKTLFTREISRNLHETPVYLVSGTLLQFLFSIIGYVMLTVLVFALPYSSDTSTVCYVMGLIIIPFSLSNITEAIFQAQEKMYLITISTVPVYILRVLVMLWVMRLNYGVSFVAGIIAISETLILFIEWGFVVQFVKPQWQINWDFIWRTFKSARTFLAIEGIAVLKGRMLVIILSLFASEVAVGLYGSVLQLMQPFEIIATSIVLAVFPGMTKAVTLGQEKQRYLAESVIEILLSVSLPFIIGLFFIGTDILIFVYGNHSFAEAAVALKVLALGLLLASFIQPLGYLLVANGFERVNLFEVMSTSVLGGCLSLVLVSQYKLMGAAITLLFMQSITFSLYVYAVYNRLFSLEIWRIARRPILISTLMLAIFLILKKVSQDIVITMVAASLAYSLIVSLIGVYALGGPSVVWAKLLLIKQKS